MGESGKEENNEKRGGGRPDGYVRRRGREERNTAEIIPKGLDHAKKPEVRSAMRNDAEYPEVTMSWMDEDRKWAQSKRGTRAQEAQWVTRGTKAQGHRCTRHKATRPQGVHLCLVPLSP